MQSYAQIDAYSKHRSNWKLVNMYSSKMQSVRAYVVESCFQSIVPCRVVHLQHPEAFNNRKFKVFVLFLGLGIFNGFALLPRRIARSHGKGIFKVSYRCSACLVFCNKKMFFKVLYCSVHIVKPMVRTYREIWKAIG